MQEQNRGPSMYDLPTGWTWASLMAGDPRLGPRRNPPSGLDAERSDAERRGATRGATAKRPGPARPRSCATSSRSATPKAEKETPTAGELKPGGFVGQRKTGWLHREGCEVRWDQINMYGWSRVTRPPFALDPQLNQIACLPVGGQIAATDILQLLTQFEVS